MTHPADQTIGAPRPNRAARRLAARRTATRSIGGALLAAATVGSSALPLAPPAGAQQRPEPIRAGDSTGLPLAPDRGAPVMAGRLVDRAGRSIANAELDMWIETAPGATPTPVGRLRTRADGRFTLARSAVDALPNRRSRPARAGATPAAPEVQNAVFVPSKDGVGLGAPQYRPVVWNPDTEQYDVLPDARSAAPAGSDDPQPTEVTVAAELTTTEATAKVSAKVSAASLAAPNANLCVINGIPRPWKAMGAPTLIGTEGQVVASILHDPASTFTTTVRYSSASTTQARVGFALTKGVNAGAGAITATDAGATVIGNTGVMSAQTTRAANGANVNRKFLITTNRYRQRWGVQINGQWQSACSAYSFYQSGWVRDWIEQNHDANGYYACPAANRSAVAGGSIIERKSKQSWEQQMAWAWSGTLDGRPVSLSLGVDKQYTREASVDVSDTFHNTSAGTKHLCGVGSQNFVQNRGKVVAQGA